MVWTPSFGCPIVYMLDSAQGSPVSDEIDGAFQAVHDFLASTVHAAGPWAVPMVVAAAGLIGMANRERLISGFGVLLALGTAAVILVVLGFQNGRL